MSCRVNHGQSWSLRLLHEKSQYDRASFVTLTYNDMCLPANSSLVKADFQNFLKRVRNDIDFKIKYYGCGEYGDQFQRPHYHLIVFGLGIQDRMIFRKNWSNGYVHVGTVTNDSIGYVTKYVNKKLYGVGAKEYTDRGVIAPFSLMSKGLGLQTLIKNQEDYAEHIRAFKGGKSVPLPRYYIKKLKQFGLLSDDRLEQKRIEKMAERLFIDIQQGKDTLEHDIKRSREYYDQLDQIDADLKASMVNKPVHCKVYRPRGPGV